MAHLPLLLTRPEADSRRFARAVCDRLGPGEVVIAPLTEIVPRPDPPDPAGHAGVILTSANALVPGIRWPAGLTAWCVGARTAAAAGAAGLSPRSAEGALEDLLALIRAERPAGRLLYLRGARVAGDLAAALAAEGIAVDEAVVYDQRACPPGPEAAALLARPGPVVIPVFSADSARRLAPFLSGSIAKCHIAAISPAVAQVLPVQSAATINVAARPDSGAMLDLLSTLETSLRA